MAQPQSDKSASILKSSFLWKKGSGVLGKTYKERLFELKSTGKLEYYEVTKDGNKTLKGTINLSSGTTVTKRTDVPSNQHKFMIKTKEREWFLWSKDHNSKTEVDEWCSLLTDLVHSANSNPNQSSSNTETATATSATSATTNNKPSPGLGHSKTLSNIDDTKESELKVPPTSLPEIENESPNLTMDHVGSSDAFDSEDLYNNITPQVSVYLNKVQG